MKSFAVFLLGVWLAGTILLAFVATQNFATVDRILSQPTPQAATPLSALPHETMRPLLRHLSSELNRLYFFAWGVAQIVFGVMLLILLLALGRRIEAALVWTDGPRLMPIPENLMAAALDGSSLRSSTSCLDSSSASNLGAMVSRSQPASSMISPMLRKLAPMTTVL